MPDRKTVQNLYIRICKDSGFYLNYIGAAILTGKVLNISPIEVWCHMGSFDTMQRIAKGTHPVLEK